jgi:hypothetical protein
LRDRVEMNGLKTMAADRTGSAGKEDGFPT